MRALRLPVWFIGSLSPYLPVPGLRSFSERSMLAMASSLARASSSSLRRRAFSSSSACRRWLAFAARSRSALHSLTLQPAIFCLERQIVVNLRKFQGCQRALRRQQHLRVGHKLAQQALGAWQVGGRVARGAQDQGESELVARGGGGVVVVLRAGDDFRLFGRRPRDQLLQQLQGSPANTVELVAAGLTGAGGAGVRCPDMSAGAAREQQARAPSAASRGLRRRC